MPRPGASRASRSRRRAALRAGPWSSPRGIGDQLRLALALEALGDEPPVLAAGLDRPRPCGLDGAARRGRASHLRLPLRAADAAAVAILRGHVGTAHRRRALRLRALERGGLPGQHGCARSPRPARAPPRVHGRGALSRRREIEEYTRHFLEPWSRITIEAEELTEAGDSVIAAVLQSGVGSESGISTELRYFHVWTFRGGRVDPAREHPRARAGSRSGRLALGRRGR